LPVEVPSHHSTYIMKEFSMSFSQNNNALLSSYLASIYHMGTIGHSFFIYVPFLCPRYYRSLLSLRAMLIALVSKKRKLSLSRQSYRILHFLQLRGCTFFPLGYSVSWSSILHCQCISNSITKHMTASVACETTY
jgi:hypothetical protein